MTQDVKKSLRLGILLTFFVFIALYAYLRSSDLILGVKIKDVNIVDGTKLTNNIFEVTGVAENATNLTLNGRTISVDQEGNFKETLALLYGYNLINIQAKDKFGNEDEKNYQLIY